MSKYIRKDDVVEVISGNYAGMRGKVLKIDRQAGKVTVQGVNVATKHVRPSRQNPQGGTIKKEMPIHISNVALLDPRTNRPTRLGVRYLEDGTKELYAKVSGATIRTISPPRPRYARKPE